jgi:hypothetical protein
MVKNAKVNPYEWFWWEACDVFYHPWLLVAIFLHFHLPTTHDEHA